MTAIARRQINELAVVGIAYALFIVLGFYDGMLGVAWPSMRAAQGGFAQPLDALGALLLATSGAFLLASFTTGRFAARLGFGALFITASVVRGLGLLGIALAPSWPWAVAAGLLFGFGSGLMDSGMNTFFAMRFDERLMNWLHAAFGIGATLGPLLMGGVLGMGLVWRWGFGLVAVLQWAGALAILLTLDGWRFARPLDGAPAGAAAHADHSAAVREALGEVGVWIGIAAFFFTAGIEMTAGAWGYTLLTEGRGIAREAATSLVTLYWASFTLSRILFGFIAPHVKTAYAIRALALGAVAGSTLIWLGGASWLTFAGLALIGFAMAPVFPLLTSATPRRLGERKAQHVVGFQVGAASLGIAALPGLAGIFAARIGVEIIGPFLLAQCIVLFVLHELMAKRE